MAAGCDLRVAAAGRCPAAAVAAISPTGDRAIALECGKCAAQGEHSPYCIACKGRGWNPLDPEKTGRWMVALAKAGFNLPMHPPYEWEPKWMCAIERADTPELALKQAAMKALGLDTEEE